MTRYFKQYIGSNKEVEISRDKAIEHIGKVYRCPKRVLRALPLGCQLKVNWAYYKKAVTK